VLHTEFGVAIVMEMAEALAVAGVAGIVHSDIKPENVVLRPDGYIKILDFGLARRVGIYFCCVLEIVT